MKETYSITEASEYLNTSPDTLATLIDVGAIPAARIGVVYVLHITDLREYLRTEVERQTAERREYAKQIAAGHLARSERPSVKTAAGAARAKHGRRRAVPSLESAHQS